MPGEGLHTVTLTVPGVVLRLAVVTLAAIALSVLAMLAVKLAGVDLKDAKQRTAPRVLAIAGLFNLLFIAAVAVILRSWDHQSLSILGFSFGINGLVFVLAAFLLTGGLALLYVWSLHSLGIIRISWSGDPYPKDLRGLTRLFFGFLILFIAALQEEILFRGYFSFALLRYGFLWALAISTVVFTLWHFLTNRVSLFQSVDWLLGGIMLYTLYWLSGSVWVAALVHFSRNFTNITVFNISSSNSLIAFHKPVTPAYKTLYTALYSCILILAGYFWFR